MVAENYYDCVTGEVKSYDQWIDEIMHVFEDEGMSEDNALFEAISTIADMVRDGELEPMC